MAQPSKRNAEQAFEDQSSESKSHKRARQKKATDSTKKQKSKNANSSRLSDAVETASSLPAVQSKKNSDTPSRVNGVSSPLEKTLSKSPIPRSREDTDKVQKQSNKQKKRKGDVPDPQSDSATTVVIAGKQKNKHQSKEKQQKHRQFDKNTWKLSKAIGGTFNNQDPILTPDGQYLILATRREVQVYSTSTSLLVRSLASPEISPVRTCTLSASSRDELFVGSKHGLICKFNWKTGKLVGQWQSELELSYLTFANASKKHEVLFAISPLSGFGSCLVLVALEQDDHQANYKVLLRRESLLDFVEFLPDLSIVIAASKDEIHYGTLAQDDNVDHGLDAYNWTSIRMKARISSCDVHVSAVPATPKLPVMNVVVGLQNGVIMVYRDLLNKLAAMEKGQNNRQLGQRLHWHRTAVRSVKWSRDGNYLISGGDETVLVLWQLDTNQKQFLPHLSTSILNIAVSKSGAYYALRLGDNSVMVLSTADLAPSTNVTGLSLSAKRASSDNILLHPSEPNKLLLATSIRSVGPNSRTEATHLQTYDIKNNIQLSRQALTRNLVTAVNVGPEGQQLHEPDVTQIQLSCDARWLSTVDEWLPHMTDVEALYLKEDSVRERLRESTLRFWCWKPDDNSWEPTTRIDEPHSSGQASVLGMASNPVTLEFATLGSDGCVKFWTPKARLRDGVLVKDRNGTPLFNWSCSQVVQIEAEPATSQSERHGTLAYSDDGSVLAVSCSGRSGQHHVHLVDVRAGDVVLSQPDVVSDMRSLLGFCGRYLIAVSDAVIVFDTITYQTAFRLELESKFISNRTERNKFLAMNAQDNMFAIGLNAASTDTGKNDSVVAIFDIDKLEKAPKQTVSIPGQLRALLVDPTTRGLVIIDGDSAIRTLSLPTSQSVVSSAMVPYAESEALAVVTKKGLEGTFGLARAKTTVPEQDQLLLQDGARPAQSLDDLLSTPAVTAQLSVQELFERVARAVSGVSVGV